MKMFPWLKRKCTLVLLGFTLRSMDGENRNVIESQRLQPKMRPYLVCLFTWLAGLASEGQEKGGSTMKSPSLILLKTNSSRVNIF